MKPGWIRRMPAGWQAAIIRWGFNWHPAYRGTGGRVDYVAPDITHIRVRLSLNRRTRNMVGSLFGGSLFAATDGPHPMMLMWALGPDYIVWDKAASIRYRKPGRGTLYGDFRIGPEEIARIRAQLETEPEMDCIYTVDLKDDEGVVHATVERTLYIARKNHYKQKTAGGERK
jgi:acyl-coenzyme A thioesterase PaaI-like protein